ncbi:MAG: RNA polymerase sigma factor [Actinobacteria bacterium]|nr:MAG: RNA polymerase sigma factor [Actinomycetota bacterium]
MGVDATMTEPMTISHAADPDTIETVYRRRHGDFLRVAAAITGSPDAALDAVQEALARAYARRRSFRGEGSLEAWLWRVVVNTARNAKRDAPVDAEPVEREAAVADSDPRETIVRAGVAALPERQRLVLFLRYYADLDYAGIASTLGIRRGTVSATLNHAHEAVRRLLAEEESS